MPDALLCVLAVQRSRCWLTKHEGSHGRLGADALEILIRGSKWTDDGIRLASDRLQSGTKRVEIQGKKMPRNLYQRTRSFTRTIVKACASSYALQSAVERLDKLPRVVFAGPLRRCFEQTAV